MDANFDVAAFFSALDEERQARDLSSAQLTGERNYRIAHRKDIRPISASTLTGMCKKQTLNGNIVVGASVARPKT